MRIVVLAGPPCSGKTTLARTLSQPGDLVLDYDDIARALGSPVQWIHPEPYRTEAERVMQARIAAAYFQPCDGTAWVVRTVPRPQQRAALAEQWQAEVYVLDPGEAECKRRAKADSRPSGTGKRIGTWYCQYRPSHVDVDASVLSSRRVVMVDPRSV